MIIESPYTKIKLPPKKFKIEGQKNLVVLDVKNGLSLGDYVINTKQNGDIDENGTIYYDNVNLIKVKEHYEDGLGSYYSVIDKPIPFERIVIDEDRKYYVTSIKRTTMKSKLENGVPRTETETRLVLEYLDPNLRPIRDVNFYDKMINLYYQKQNAELQEIRESVETGKEYLYVQLAPYDFIEQFRYSKNPFEKNKKLTQEQCEEFLSFTDAMLKKNFTSETFEPSQEYYELSELAKKFVETEKTLK